MATNGYRCSSSVHSVTLLAVRSPVRAPSSTAATHDPGCDRFVWGGYSRAVLARTRSGACSSSGAPPTETAASAAAAVAVTSDAGRTSASRGGGNDDNEEEGLQSLSRVSFCFSCGV